MARAIRTLLVGRHALDPQWVKASAYWRDGAVGRHELIGDP